MNYRRLEIGQLVYDQYDISELFTINTPNQPDQVLSMGSFVLQQIQLNNQNVAGWVAADGNGVVDAAITPGTVYLNHLIVGSLRPGVMVRWRPDATGFWRLGVKYNNPYPAYGWPALNGTKQYDIMSPTAVGSESGGRLIVARKEEGIVNYTIVCLDPASGLPYDPDPLPVVMLLRSYNGALALDVNVGSNGMAVLTNLAGQPGVYTAALDMQNAMFEYYVLLTKYGQVTRADQLYLSNELQMVKNSMENAGQGANQKSLTFPVMPIKGT